MYSWCQDVILFDRNTEVFRNLFGLFRRGLHIVWVMCLPLFTLCGVCEVCILSDKNKSLSLMNFGVCLPLKRQHTMSTIELAVSEDNGAI